MITITNNQYLLENSSKETLIQLVQTLQLEIQQQQKVIESLNLEITQQKLKTINKPNYLDPNTINKPNYLDPNTTNKQFTKITYITNDINNTYNTNLTEITIPFNYNPYIVSIPTVF